MSKTTHGQIRSWVVCWVYQRFISLTFLTNISIVQTDRDTFRDVLLTSWPTKRRNAMNRITVFVLAALVIFVLAGPAAAEQQLSSQDDFLRALDNATGEEWGKRPETTTEGLRLLPPWMPSGCTADGKERLVAATSSSTRCLPIVVEDYVSTSGGRTLVLDMEGIRLAFSRSASGERSAIFVVQGPVSGKQRMLVVNNGDPNAGAPDAVVFAETTTFSFDPYMWSNAERLETVAPFQVGEFPEPPYVCNLAVRRTRYFDTSINEDCQCSGTPLRWKTSQGVSCGEKKGLTE